jgi:hypothetical protein
MNIFSGKKQKEFNFKIYTNEYLKLKKPTEAEADNETVFKFTALGDFDFNNVSNVPYEPLEAGDFSSDSIQSTPFTISIQAIYTPFVTSKKDNLEVLRNKTNKVIEALEKYSRSNTTLLTIMNEYPVLKIYKDLLLKQFNYKLKDGVGLFANLGFQESRISTNNPDGLPADDVENPENGASKDNGTVSTKETTKEVTPS